MAPIILMRMEKGCRLIAGELRPLACRELGLPTIPARILDMEGNREEILRAEVISVMRHNINGSIFRCLSLDRLRSDGIEYDRILFWRGREMNQGNAKKVKTVRFDDMELERIRSAAIRHHLSEAEVIRKVVRIGLVDLLDGEDEDELLRQRKADKSPDVDGQSFLNSLKAEFNI